MSAVAESAALFRLKVRLFSLALESRESKRHRRVIHCTHLYTSAGALTWCFEIFTNICISFRYLEAWNGRISDVKTISILVTAGINALVHA